MLRWFCALLSCAGAALASELDPTLYAECSEFAQVESMPADAAQRCRPISTSDHPGAQYVYGLILLNTEGSVNEGLSWLRKAAQQDHPPANAVLARIYQANGVTKATPSMQDYARVAYCAGYPGAQELKSAISGEDGQVSCEGAAEFRFEGSWTGELLFWQAPRETPSKQDPVKFRLLIEADSAQGQQWLKGRWVDTKKLSAREVDGLQTLQATDAGWDFDGKWVENWTIQLQRLDKDRVHAHWTRAVSNLHLPSDNPDKTFVQVASGELRRDESGDK